MSGLAVKTGVRAPAAPCPHPFAKLKQQLVLCFDPDGCSRWYARTYCACGVPVGTAELWRKTMTGE